MTVRRQLACRRAWRALDFDDLEGCSDPDDDASWSLDRYDEEEFWSQIQQRRKSKALLDAIDAIALR